MPLLFGDRAIIVSTVGVRIELGTEFSNGTLQPLSVLVRPAEALYSELRAAGLATEIVVQPPFDKNATPIHVMIGTKPLPKVRNR
jgi:hypothetical protein